MMPTVPVFDVYQELRAIIDALESGKLEYAVCGAVALAVHGHPRATTDIDVLVPPSLLDGVKGLLRGLGYALEAAPMRFASGIRVHRQSRIEDSEIVTVDLRRAHGTLIGWRESSRIP